MSLINCLYLWTISVNTSRDLFGPAVHLVVYWDILPVRHDMLVAFDFEVTRVEYFAGLS